MGGGRVPVSREPTGPATLTIGLLCAGGGIASRAAGRLQAEPAHRGSASGI